MPEYRFCPYLGDTVEVTDERYVHVLRRHSDFAPAHWQRVEETLLDPDQGRASVAGADVIVFFRWYPDVDKYVIAVINIESEIRRWLMTAYSDDRIFQKVCRRTYEEVFTQPVSHDTTLTFRYDSDSDVLTIFQYPSYTGQITKEIDDFVIAGMNPSTMAIEYVEILLFRRRLERDGKIVLPINATFRLVKSAVAAD